MLNSRAPDDAAPPASPRILLVEDEAPLRDIYVTMLTLAGYRVQAAGSGRRAVSLLWENSFDLVITDIRMPDVDGVDVLRAARERDLDVPVILITGDPTVDTAVRALDLGALRYLVKPVEEKELLEVVAKGVKLHELARMKRLALTELGDGSGLVGDRAGLEVTYRRALDTLWMAYQPIFDASTGEIYGHEALLRTSEPAVPHPGAFLDISERLGAMLELALVIRERAVGPEAPPGNLLVNLHPLELTDERLYSSDSPLASNASRVVLEITERVSLDGVGDLDRRVRALRDLGFRIAVDDLGAGYAGLTSFATLEPEIVKLDTALVRNVDSLPIKRQLIGSMTSLCKDLGTLVVAEGIETEAERDVIVELGCDLLQGFLLGRPERRAATDQPTE